MHPTSMDTQGVEPPLKLCGKDTREEGGAALSPALDASGGFPLRVSGGLVLAQKLERQARYETVISWHENPAC